MGGKLSGFKEKYQNMPAPVRAAMWFTVCSFLQRGITMITTPIFTRILSTDEYGLYSTYLSWESVFNLLVTLSLYKAMMNLYVKYDDHDRVLSAVCGLELLISGAWAVIGCVFCVPIGGLLKISPVLVCCLFLSFVFQAVLQCWSLEKRYSYDYRAIIVVTLLSTAASTLVSVLAVCFVAPTADMRAATSVAVTVVVGIVLYIAVFRRNRTFYDKKVWLFSLGFCIPLLPHYLSEFVLQSSDKIMINYLCGSGDVAMYSIAYAAGSLINLITNAINSSFAPFQYQKIASGEYKVLSKRANQVLLFVAVMLMGIMLFSREIVLIFGGYKYLESVDVIIPICIGVFFNYTFQLFARVQEYYERKLTVVIPSILCAVLNLILNYIFIRLCGYQAAAYTTFFCYALFCLVHYFFYRRVCREEVGGEQLYDVKGILLISVGVIVAGALIMLVNNVLWLKYTIIGLGLVAMIVMHRRLIAMVRSILSKN